jgi:hypothetical protein
MRKTTLSSLRFRPLLSALTLGLSLVPFGAQAGSFDDAVNLYLKGFEDCQAANKALTAGDLEKARTKITEYDKTFAQARAIDSTIASSKERNMEGNIVVCKRIATDIANRAGQPLMEQALAYCKNAEAAIEGGQPDLASSRLDEFRAMRDRALGVSPGLKEIFSIKNQLGRCERLENKIGRVAAKQDAEDAKVDAVINASKNYADTCKSAADTLAGGKTDDATLRSVNVRIGNAQNFKKGSVPGPEVKKIFAARTDHPGITTIANNVKAGDACLAALQKQVATKTTELANMRKAASGYNQQAGKLADACTDATRMASGTPSEESYNAARKKADDVTSQARTLLAKMNGDANFSRAREAGVAGDTQKKVDEASRCSASIDKPLKQMMAALTAKKAEEKAKADAEAKKKADEAARLAAEAEAKKKADALAAAEAAKLAEKAAAAKAAEEAAAKTAAKAAVVAGAAVAAGAADAASKATEAGKANAEEPAPSAPAAVEKGIFGTLTLQGKTPAYGILYLADGSAPASVEPDIGVGGFKQPVYLVKAGGRIDIKNSDNAMHRINAADLAGKVDIKLPMMQSRSRKTIEASWPVNTAVEITTENPRHASTWVVTATGSKGTLINVKSGKADFKLPASASGKAVLVVPGFDPVEVALGGATIKKPVTRSGAAAGELVLEQR